MSEWDAQVYCTCFQDRLLEIEPPYPRSQLTVNRFGIVTLVGSTNHADDPDDLWDWRCGWSGEDDDRDESRCSPCSHDWMRLVSASPFYTPASWQRRRMNPEVAYEQLEGTLYAHKDESPVLSDVLYRDEEHDYPSGGVWVVSSEAGLALDELLRLIPLLPTPLNKADDYFVTNLRALLEASVKTGNPIICHYNGIIDGAF